MAAQLRDSGGGLDALDGGDSATDIRAVFSWSYRALGPAAARLFRLLGLHAGPDITAAAAASLAGVPPSDVRPALTELTRAQLIVERAPGRFGCHDLLRAYAADRARAEDTGEQRLAAVHRVLDHYLTTAHAAARLLYPHRDPITLATPQPGVTPESLTDHRQALAWFTAEYPVLLTAVDQAGASGLDTHVWQLAWTLRDYLNWQGRWHDWAATQTAAVDAAGRLGDRSAQAQAHRGLARAYTELGRLDDARTHLTGALELSDRTGDHTAAAHTHIDLAEVHTRRGQHREALDHARAALEPLQTAGHRAGQARALNQLGWCHAQLGNHTEALDRCQQALALHQELGNRWGEAGTWDSLGYAHHQAGQHAKALDCYQHALDLYRDLGDHYGEADVLAHRGDTHRAADNPDAAATDWRHALDIIGQSEHPIADQLRSRLRQLHPRRPQRPEAAAAGRVASPGCG
jgi:tetratricopeptide (TPR) repeat protein